MTIEIGCRLVGLNASMMRVLLEFATYFEREQQAVIQYYFWRVCGRLSFILGPPRVSTNVHETSV